MRSSPRRRGGGGGTRTRTCVAPAERARRGRRLCGRGAEKAASASSIARRSGRPLPRDAPAFSPSCFTGIEPMVPTEGFEPSHSHGLNVRPLPVGLDRRIHGTGREDRTLLALLVMQTSSPDEPAPQENEVPEEGLAPSPLRFKGAYPSLDHSGVENWRLDRVGRPGRCHGAVATDGVGPSRPRL